MNHPEVYEIPQLFEGHSYALLTAEIDPIDLAHQALLKLKNNGLIGILEPSEPLTMIKMAEASVSTTDNVVYIQNYSEKKTDQTAHSQTEGSNLAVNEHLQFTARQVELFNKYLPRVIPIARATVWRGKNNTYQDLEEAIGDGYLGLVIGVKKYDPAKVSEQATTGEGFIFEHVKGAILKGMRSRFGRGPAKQGGKIARRKPSVISGTAYSLDAPLTDSESDENITLAEVIPLPNDDKGAYEQLKSEALRVISQYNARDREIFIRRWFAGEAQTLIAQAVGISQMHVSRRLNVMYEDIKTSLNLERDSRSVRKLEGKKSSRSSPPAENTQQTIAKSPEIEVVDMYTEMRDGREYKVSVLQSG